MDYLVLATVHTYVKIFEKKFAKKICHLRMVTSQGNNALFIF